MAERLQGKIALVTGAGQGIGRAISQAFVAEGARVIATDINPVTLEEFAAVVAVETALLDVTDPQAITDCAARFPDVNVLVNCSGMVAHGTVLDCSDNDWEKSLSLNVTSIFHMIQAFLPGMLEGGSGSIVNIASVCSSLRGAANRFAYGASKGAVLGITKSVAMDYVKQGVRCNAICPGTVDSPSLQDRIRAGGDYEKTRQDFIDRQPMGRLGTVEEIAALAVLLASDESAFMTGTESIIDGGWSM